MNITEFAEGSQIENSARWVRRPNRAGEVRTRLRVQRFRTRCHFRVARESRSTHGFLEADVLLLRAGRHDTTAAG
jgi:hypothetical protein